MPIAAIKTGSGAIVKAQRSPSAPPKKAPRRPSVGEALLETQLKACKLTGYEREYKFHPTRKWRFDFAWPFLAQKLAVEVEGGVFVQGRHSRGAAFEADCEKYAEAMLMGYRVLRVTTRQVKTGLALLWITRALGITAAGRDTGEQYDPVSPVSPEGK